MQSLMREVKVNAKYQEMVRRKKGERHACHLVVITEKLSPFRSSVCSCRFRELITYTLSHRDKHTHIYKHTHMISITHMHTCLGLCFELILATRERHSESWLIIILSYGLHMVIWFYCYEEIWILWLSQAA